MKLKTFHYSTNDRKMFGFKKIQEILLLTTEACFTSIKSGNTLVQII